MTVSTTAPVREGDVLARKYRVEKVLGAGGMGVVVSAMHLQLEQRVALKFLLPAALASPEVVERFAREARAAARIRSEHVARVIDVGELDSGSPFMVMEFLEGQDLAQTLATRGPCSVGDLAHYILEACDAIAEAHAAGIVHRDLKPANLFLAKGAGGTTIVKVLDFGISKSTSSQAAGQLTSTQALLGSPFYMSPEQLMAPKTIDARSDIWALGVIMYELLSGRTPFVAETMPALVAAIMSSTPVPIERHRPDLPPAFSALVTRCLSKARAERFASVAELARALAPFASVDATRLRERISRVLGESDGLSPDTASAGLPSASALSPTISPAASAPIAAPQATSFAASRSAWGTTQGAVSLRVRRFPIGLVVSLVGVTAVVFGTLLFMRQSPAPPAPAVAVAQTVAPPTPAASVEPTPSATPIVLVPTTTVGPASSVAAAPPSVVGSTAAKPRPLRRANRRPSAVPAPPAAIPSDEPTNRLKMDIK